MRQDLRCRPGTAPARRLRPEGRGKEGDPPPALITVTQVGSGEFEVVEETLGTLEVLADPKIGAEVPGASCRFWRAPGQRVKAGTTAGGDRCRRHDPAEPADEAEARRLEALPRSRTACSSASSR
jgi:hypothetical protein